MMSRITQYRLRHGWSKENLSRLFSIPARIVERWERGELTPPAWAEAMIERRAREEAFRCAKARRGKKTRGGEGEKRWPPC